MTELLFDRMQSLLAVIDVQKVFHGKPAQEHRTPLVARIVRRVRIATALEIPVVARMRAAAVTLTTAKGICCEWLRDLAALAPVRPLVSRYQPEDLVR